ncbi:MAG: hypothetical protein K8T89_21355, partial [Planctomycetes bacterium]|nr:hypothetical protein [Planctomycetota bacterium]
SALFVVSAIASAEDLKSGPQVGDKLPGAFHPLNLTGAEAGKKNCLVCQNGTNPVVMIFAREIDPGLTLLIKKIDNATVANRKVEMGSFVVFCTPDEELEPKIKQLGEMEKLKECILAKDTPAGPRGYKIAKDAAITVVLYTNREIKANYVFRKDQLKADDVEKILKDLPKITTPPKE